MTLDAGTLLGAYEITGSIGAGGMGEVFRAHEATLNRDVAIKVLPAAMAADPERLARFRREAQVLASLNHPNIAHVYGFEGATLPDRSTVHFLAMELVEGDDLSVRLTRGPIPLEEAIAIAKQIAEAVEDAHEHGIIHRDLKPANVKVTPEGKVKVLDFGLAKAYEGDGSATGDLSHSPTMSRHMTEAGIILGTAAYMSPEQARGKPVDRRSDVWSFGVVLFEMLTGTRLFTGETTSDVLARVLMAEPDWNLLPAATPDPIRKLLRRCLAREPRNRLRDIGEARIGLEEYQANPAASVMMSGISVPATDARPGNRALPWAAALVIGLVAAAVAWYVKPVPAAPQPLRRFSIAVEKMVGPGSISPDGKRIVYRADSKLWVRDIDQIEPRVLAPVPGLEPFWSPDSRNVAYVFEDKLYRVAAAGGNPTPIAPLNFGQGGAPGGAWTIDDRILYSSSSTSMGIFEVRAEGGAFHEVVKVDPATDSDFHQPSLLPDGQSFLFVADLKDDGPIQIEVYSGGKRKVLLREGKGDYVREPVYSPSGHILYSRRLPPAGIWAVRFSPSRLEVIGDPFLVAPDVGLQSIASDGTLVFRPAASTSQRQLAWVDHSGKILSPIGEPQNNPRSPRLSPDGKRVAFTADAGTNVRELFVMALPDGVPARLTFTPENESEVEWLPSGRDLVFSSTSTASGTKWLISRKPADGTGQVDEITEGMEPNVAPDGTRLLYNRDDTLWSVALQGEAKPVPFLTAEKKEVFLPTISPDGRFVAYVSTETGEAQVYVRPYPEGEAKWQISTARGAYPRWNRRGDRLYFLDNTSALWEVEIETRPAFGWKAPQRLFASSPLDRSWDFAPDGRMLAFVPIEAQGGAATVPTMIVTENWFAEFEDKKKN